MSGNGWRGLVGRLWGFCKAHFGGDLGASWRASNQVSAISMKSSHLPYVVIFLSRTFFGFLHTNVLILLVIAYVV